MVRTHGEGEPGIVIVEPFVISSLQYESSGLVENRVGNQYSGEAEPVFVAFPVFETCRMVMLCYILSCHKTSHKTARMP
jgi:hypothetical protein